MAIKSINRINLFLDAIEKVHLVESIFLRLKNLKIWKISFTILMKCSKAVELIASHSYTKNPLNKCSTDPVSAWKMHDQISGVGTKNFMPHKLWLVWNHFQFWFELSWARLLHNGYVRWIEQTEPGIAYAAYDMPYTVYGLSVRILHTNFILELVAIYFRRTSTIRASDWSFLDSLGPQDDRKTFTVYCQQYLKPGPYRLYI